MNGDYSQYLEDPNSKQSTYKVDGIPSTQMINHGAQININDNNNHSMNNHLIQHYSNAYNNNSNHQFQFIASAAEDGLSSTMNQVPGYLPYHSIMNIPVPDTKKPPTSRRKRKLDDEVPDELWECVLCHVKAHMTPLKRKNPVDGKRNICNACYVRQRVRKERSERGMSRPILPPSNSTAAINNIKGPQVSRTTGAVGVSSSQYSVKIDKSCGKNLNVSIVPTHSASTAATTTASSSSSSPSLSFKPILPPLMKKSRKRMLPDAPEEMNGFISGEIHQPLPTMATAAFPQYMTFFQDGFQTNGNPSVTSNQMNMSEYYAGGGEMTFKN